MPSYRQLTLDVPEADALLISSALESFGAPEPLSVTARRMGRFAPWRVEAIFSEPPDQVALAAFLREIAPDAHYEIAPLPDEDWVALSQSQLPPIRTRRFYVRNYDTPVPADIGARDVITIEAGLAFGTGHHASTHGCLKMIETLAERAFRPRRVLDLGAGTALLAIAALKAWPGIHILATDNDPVAVDVARRNCLLNEAPGIRHLVADGFKHPAVRAAAPFDLVIANILALPLKRLSRQLALHTREGGRIILSGILDEQAPSVIACYRDAGCRHLVRRDLEGWSGLLFERTVPAEHGQRAGVERECTARFATSEEW